MCGGQRAGIPRNPPLPPKKKYSTGTVRATPVLHTPASLTPVALPLCRPPPAAHRKSVLFIIADDMRPQLGCYGHSFMHTPHIDQLAATGTLFTRAFVQYAFCAPSRNSKCRLSRLRDHFRETTTRSQAIMPGRSRDATVLGCVPRRLHVWPTAGRHPRVEFPAELSHQRPRHRLDQPPAELQAERILDHGHR